MSEFTPVFIIGLHRSGTTFLYETLYRALPVQAVTLFHVFNHERLSEVDDRGDEECLRRELKDRFARAKISDRGIDRIAVSDETVEEYGWILKYRTGSFGLTRRNIAVFEQLCRSLTGLTERNTLLFKNPWDTINVPFIAERFPNSKFIFLSRKPEDILKSQLNAAMIYAERPSPFLSMLLEPIPRGYLYLTFHRYGRSFLGRKLFRLVMTAIFKVTIARELTYYRRVKAGLSSGRFIEISYEDFIADVDAGVAVVKNFIYQ